MAGSGKLRVSSTKYFDIIYSEQTEVTASLLYQRADGVMDELAQAYGIEPAFRLPVVIAGGVEQFNAYYSYYPFNHIVIYDTAEIQDLTVFTETLINVFKHELTHAYTHNLKSKSLRLASGFFGDALSGHYLSVSSGMAEGATVSYESAAGEGRLNSPYFLHLIRQAKIEDKFPSYADESGAADSYPSGAFYNFNGAFADYIQKNYGMQKYAQFWYRCINMKNFTISGAFKYVYGIKLKDAWKQFRDYLEVPEVGNADPVVSAFAKDFFASHLKNNSGSLYSGLCATPYGLVYYDKKSDSVYIANENGKAKKLFAHKYIDYLKASADGRFIAVGYYTNTSAVVKHSAGIYDLQTKKWYATGQTGITYPSVVSNGSEYYFVCRKYSALNYKIQVQKIKLEKKITGLEPYSEYEFEYAKIPFELTDTGNGAFAFILKEGLENSLCITDLNFSGIKEYKTPLSKMSVRTLSYSGNALVFSWAVKETFPRFGKLDLTDGKFTLSQQDISGGVYYPVYQNQTLVYIGQFYRQNKIFTAGPRFTQRIQEYPSQETELLKETAEPLPQQTVELAPYKDFSDFDYAFKGLIIPVSFMSTSGVMTSAELSSIWLPLGLTYITSMPWDSGELTITGGYGIKSQTGGFGIVYKGGTDTSLFNYQLESTLLLDKEGFVKSQVIATVASSLSFGKRSAFGLTLNGDITDFRGSVLFSSQNATVTYTNVINPGPGDYEQSGFLVFSKIFHDGGIVFADGVEELEHNYALGLGGVLYIPKLIPVDCVYRFTYNLPTKISAGLTLKEFTQLRSVIVMPETVLFGFNIQKAPPFMRFLYLNRTNLALRYNGEYVENTWIDYFTLRLNLEFTPNMGTFANERLKNTFFILFNFGKSQNLPQKIINVGLEMNF